ncbi:unnamed protein product, partial [Protopolystoma xenopodis]
CDDAFKGGGYEKQDEDEDDDAETLISPSEVGTPQKEHSPSSLFSRPTTVQSNLFQENSGALNSYASDHSYQLDISPSDQISSSLLATPNYKPLKTSYPSSNVRSPYRFSLKISGASFPNHNPLEQGVRYTSLKEMAEDVYTLAVWTSNQLTRMFFDESRLAGLDLPDGLRQNPQAPILFQAD